VLAYLWRHSAGFCLRDSAGRKISKTCVNHPCHGLICTNFCKASSQQIEKQANAELSRQGTHTPKYSKFLQADLCSSFDESPTTL
jgi:hypothetical protein